MFADLADRPGFSQPPFAHSGNPVADPQEFGKIAADQKDGLAGAGQMDSQQKQGDRRPAYCTRGGTDHAHVIGSWLTRPYKRTARLLSTRAVRNNPGSDLLSHTLTRAAPSAVEGLTSVFGMGTSVTPLL